MNYLRNQGLNQMNPILEFQITLAKMQATMMLMNVVSWGNVKKRLNNSAYDALFQIGGYIVLENLNKLIEKDVPQTVNIRQKN